MAFKLAGKPEVIQKRTCAKLREDERYIVWHCGYLHPQAQPGTSSERSRQESCSSLYPASGAWKSFWETSVSLE